MDPNACWKRFLDAMGEGAGDELEAYHALNDLSDWLLHGGALPDGVPSANVVHNLLVAIGLACDQLNIETDGVNPR